MNLTKTANAIVKKAAKGVTQSTVAKRQKLIYLAQRDGKTCWWCGEAVRFQWEKGVPAHHPLMATFDHIITKDKGGSHKPKNGKLACAECNCVRSNTEFNKFTKLVAELGMPEIKRRAKERAEQNAIKRGWTNRQRRQARKWAKESAERAKQARKLIAVVA